MRIAVMDGPGSVRVTSDPTDQWASAEGGSESDEVVVDVAYVGLCGTDLELFHGTSAYLRDGRTGYPHHFGHEWVGTVTAVGATVTSIAVGTTVTGSTMIWCGRCAACARGRRNRCTNLREIGLYGFAGAAAAQLRLPARAVAAFGPGVRPRPHHVLVEPLATVLEAVALAAPEPGERVLVTGGGTIGLLAAAVLARYPVTVDLADPKLPTGPLEETGWWSSRYRDAADAPRQSHDLVLECSGAMGALGAALPTLVPGGRCVLVGVSETPEPVTPGLIALDGLSLLGVRHGIDHYLAAIALLDRLGVEVLIDEVFPLDHAAAAFARLGSTRPRPKVVLRVD